MADLTEIPSILSPRDVDELRALHKDLAVTLAAQQFGNTETVAMAFRCIAARLEACNIVDPCFHEAYARVQRAILERDIAFARAIVAVLDRAEGRKAAVPDEEPKVQ